LPIASLRQEGVYGVRIDGIVSKSARRLTFKGH
jgi:hypothetical protein